MRNRAMPFHTTTESHTDSKAAATVSHALASTCEPADGLSGQTDQPGEPYRARPGHFSHAVEPIDLANVPSGHGPHDEKPLSEKTPALHTSHEVDLGLFE